MPTAAKFFMFTLACAASLLTAPVRAADGWSAGVASAVITPAEPLWMAGYGSRTEPASGKETELFAKALALRDAAGNRAVFFSTDLLGIPQSIQDRVITELGDKLGLKASQIMLASSHTHCGPVLRGALHDIYPLDDKQLAMIEAYSTHLEKTLVSLATEAFAQLRPASLQRGAGQARFAVNRRNNPEPKVPELREANQLVGPIDHAVPVLKVSDAAGKPMALVFGYACHNTVLAYQKWCGDYAGFAQLELERRHPGVAAMFFMGCGADQNPLPRRSVELCQNYGRQLADAVDDALRQPMKPVRPILATAHRNITLMLDAPPSRAELNQLAAGSGHTQRWAKRLLRQLDAGEPLQTTYRYPVQVWRLGGEQWWIGLAGEVVVDYSLRLRKEIAEDAWVAGYVNDVMAYIPSERVRREGGYEGATSMFVYGLPAFRWAADVETSIVNTVHELANELR